MIWEHGQSNSTGCQPTQKYVFSSYTTYSIYSREIKSLCTFCRSFSVPILGTTCDPPLPLFCHDWCAYSLLPPLPLPLLSDTHHRFPPCFFSPPPLFSTVINFGGFLRPGAHTSLSYSTPPPRPPSTPPHFCGTEDGAGGGEKKRAEVSIPTPSARHLHLLLLPPPPPLYSQLGFDWKMGGSG